MDSAFVRIGAFVLVTVSGIAYTSGCYRDFSSHKFGLAARRAEALPRTVATTIDKALADPNLRSREGRTIELIQIKIGPASDGSSAPTRFLVQGGLHGNEKLPPKFVLWLATRVARGESALNFLPLKQFEIDFLPSVNPDGREASTRANTAGVNLNRNFGVLWGFSRENPGNASFSEPETRGIKSLFENRGYQATVDIHGYIKWIVAPSEPELVAREATPNPETKSRYKTWMKSLARVVSYLGGYQLQTAGGLGDGGAFEDWAFWKANAYSFCLEIASPVRFADENAFATFSPGGILKMVSSQTKPTPQLQPSTAVDSFLVYEHAIFMAFSEAIAASSAFQSSALQNQ